MEITYRDKNERFVAIVRLNDMLFGLMSSMRTTDAVIIMKKVPKEV